MERNFDSDFYAHVLNKIKSYIYVTDINTDEIIYMNDALKRLLKIEKPEGKICWKVLETGLEKRCDFCKIDDLIKSGGDGSYCWEGKSSITGRIYRNFDSMILWNGKTYHIQNSIDITEQAEISHNATIDELTGILNRRAGKERLSELIENLSGDRMITVALFDVNELKTINDMYGHSEGDIMLNYIVKITERNLTGENFAFRLSGDEFVVVFCDSKISAADECMKSVLKQLDDEREKNDISYNVSFSYGMAEIYSDNKYSVSDILSIADARMYIQKRDYHIRKAKLRLHENNSMSNVEDCCFEYDKDKLYKILVDSTDDFLFIGNMKTGEFMYPERLVTEFGLPSKIISNAAAVWSELIHPEDEMTFLRSNQEIADGRLEQHIVEYRARNTDGNWVKLRCRGKMMRDAEGEPEIFAGFISKVD